MSGDFVVNHAFIALYWQRSLLSIRDQHFRNVNHFLYNSLDLYLSISDYKIFTAFDLEMRMSFLTYYGVSKRNQSVRFRNATSVRLYGEVTKWAPRTIQRNIRYKVSLVRTARCLFDENMRKSLGFLGPRSPGRWSWGIGLAERPVISPIRFIGWVSPQRRETSIYYCTYA